MLGTNIVRAYVGRGYTYINETKNLFKIALLCHSSAKQSRLHDSSYSKCPGMVVMPVLEYQEKRGCTPG